MTTISIPELYWAVNHVMAWEAPLRSTGLQIYFKNTRVSPLPIGGKYGKRAMLAVRRAETFIVPSSHGPAKKVPCALGISVVNSFLELHQVGPNLRRKI